MDDDKQQVEKMDVNLKEVLNTFLNLHFYYADVHLNCVRILKAKRVEITEDPKYPISIQLIDPKYPKSVDKVVVSIYRTGLLENRRNEGTYYHKTIFLSERDAEKRLKDVVDDKIWDITQQIKTLQQEIDKLKNETVRKQIPLN